MKYALVLCEDFNVDASFCLYSPYSSNLVSEFLADLSNVYNSLWAKELLNKIDICKNIDGFVELKIEVLPDKSGNSMDSKMTLFAEFSNHDSMIIGKLSL